MMRLTAFRVTNFRSVEDSEWLDVSDITALIGTNESGKTNVLLPLWKLNPAMEGKIDLLADAPRKRYNEIRAMEEKPSFIQARFELSDELINQIVALTGSTRDDVQIVEVSRYLDDRCTVGFPNADPVRSTPARTVTDHIASARKDITAMDPTTKVDETLKEAALTAVAAAAKLVSGDGDIGISMLREVKAALAGADPSAGSKRSVIGPRFGQLADVIDETIAEVSKPYPHSNPEARKLVMNNLLSFVYYSNYGNLDSEIYLPHVIENLKRSGLGSREEAKARTLRVLFDFVRLEPEEILELGRDFPQGEGEPTDEQIKKIADKKKERTILLQSASSELTEKFRSWWKQGDYRIRFHADGDHFRIWVSDDRRPEEIELEGRSTGLQWFLSFYLIFLVESGEGHKGSMLLLDEPRLSLHPIAQRDLSDFFENLANTNQLAYTTHSPFMVDPNHLDRVKAVYVDEDGATAVSSDLRAAEREGPQSKSIYPVHAALGLSVSDVMMVGCQPVIVEGMSDQLYFSAIKNYLIRHGRITPRRELLFVPAGGVKAVSSYVGLFTAKEEEAPYVVLDSDAAGKQFEKNLKNGPYKGIDDRIVGVGVILGMAGAEVEDLMPTDFMARILARQYRATNDDDFDDIVISGQPIVPQFEQFAENEGISLELGWKVEIARIAKERLLRTDNVLKSQPDLVDLWTEMFEKFDI